MSTSAFAEFLSAHPISRRIGPLSSADRKRLGEDLVPSAVIDFLTTQGLCFFSGDFFATTLPHWHTDALRAAKLNPAKCFPFLRTALGTLIFEREGHVCELSVSRKKPLSTSWDVHGYLNVWLTSTTALDDGLDRDVFEKFAAGTAKLALDEYFEIEPRPTGAYKVHMGLTSKSKQTKTWAARVARMGAPQAAAAPVTSSAAPAPRRRGRSTS